MAADPSPRKTRSYQSSKAGKEEKKKQEELNDLKEQFSEEFNTHLSEISGTRIGGRKADNLVRCLNALARECLDNGVTCAAIGYNGQDIYVAGNDNTESKKIAEKLNTLLEQAQKNQADLGSWLGKKDYPLFGRDAKNKLLKNKVDRGRRKLKSAFDLHGDLAFLFSNKSKIIAAIGDAAVHAECRIIAIAPNQKWTIGISKLCCAMCYLFISTAPATPVIVSGCHCGKYAEWDLPANFMKNDLFLRRFLGDDAYKTFGKLEKLGLRNEILNDINGYVQNKKQTSNSYSSSSETEEEEKEKEEEVEEESEKEEPEEEVDEIEPAEKEPEVESEESEDEIVIDPKERGRRKRKGRSRSRSKSRSKSRSRSPDRRSGRRKGRKKH